MALAQRLGLGQGLVLALGLELELRLGLGLPMVSGLALGLALGQHPMQGLAPTARLLWLQVSPPTRADCRIAPTPSTA